MKKLLGVEVDNTMLEDGPKYGLKGKVPRWTYYLFCTNVFQVGKKNIRLTRSRFIKTVTGDTREQIGERLRAVFDDSKWELLPSS